MLEVKRGRGTGLGTHLQQGPASAAQSAPRVGQVTLLWAMHLDWEVQVMSFVETYR